MNDADLAALLRRQNPWWINPTWHQDDPDLRTADQSGIRYEPAPLECVRPPGLYVLRGPRRVGKSLELKRTVIRLTTEASAPPRNIIFCACDTLRSQDIHRLFAVGRNLTRTMSGPRYWLLDEITAVNGPWSSSIKHARDQTAVKEDCVILTGSSARDLHEARKDLAGRRGGVNDSERLLLPMGFRAFCHLIGGVDAPELPHVRPPDFLSSGCRDALSELAFWQDQLQQAWEVFLDVGGFPRAVNGFKRAAEVEPSFVEELWHVASGEAVRRSTISDAEFHALMGRLVRNLGSPLNLTKIARDVGLSSNHRVSDRLQDLVASFLLWTCYQHRAGVPQVAAQRKAYFIDPILAALPHRLNPAVPPPDHSQLAEQQLGNALLRSVIDGRTEPLVEGGEVMYERTPTGAEIDFVGPQLGVAFESKYVDDGWRREARTLISRHRRGVVATRAAFNVEGDVWAVPISMVAWMLPQ